MKIAFFLFILFVSLSAKAQSPWYFGSGEAVNLTNGTAFKNGVKNIAGSLDPSSVAVNAPAGSMYFATSGTIYVKQDAGLTTNWLPLGIATTGSLTTINGQSGPGITLASGSAGTDFAVSASSNTITFNIPSSSGSNRGLLTSANWTTFNNKEPAITATTSADYYRGDKTFATLDKTAVGLANVDNTSDANKPVSTATQTALDLKADASDLAATDAAVALKADITLVDTKITGVASSVGDEIMLFSSTTGKAAKKATGTGFVKATSGVYSTAANIDLAADVGASILPMSSGGTDKALTPVLGGVVYTDAGSMEVLPAGSAGQELQSNAGAAPSWVDKSIPIKAENASSVSAKEIQVPASQLTETDSGKFRVETGNSNLLANPSGEHLTAGSGWSSSVTSTATATYGSATTTTKELGSKQITFSCAGGASGGTCLFYQDATTSKVIQGIAFAYLSTTNAAATQFYSRVNGANNKSIALQQTSEFLYKIPEILGSSSTGLGVLVTAPASTTYTGTIDGAFVGAVDLKQDAVAISVQSTEISATGTIAAGAVVTATPINTTGSGLYTFSSGLSTMLKNAKVDISCSLRTSGATTAAPSIYVNESYYISIDNAAATTNVHASASATLNLSVGDTVKCVNTGAGASDRIYLSVTATSTENTSVYSAQNANTGRASCGHTTSDFTGFGTVTNIETFCERDGEYLIMDGKFTGGTSTATEARIALKLSGASVTSASVSKIPSLQLAGKGNRDASSTTFFSAFTVLREPSVGYVTFGAENSTLNGITKQNGSSIFGAGAVISFYARIPIASWENSNSIIGTFNEVVTSPGISKPKTCHYAFGGASSTLASPTNCTTGTCVEVFDSCGATPPARTALGVYESITFPSGTWANSSPVSCSCRTIQAGPIGADCTTYSSSNAGFWSSDSSGGSVLRVYAREVDATPLAVDVYATIKCEGQAP